MDHFPKIIHQIWIQGEDKIPTKYYPNIQKIKSLHSNWNYKLWDHNKIVNLLETNQKLIQTYNKLKYMHLKIDFAKYVILYYEGGIYIDMDATFIKPIDELLDKYIEYDLIISNQGINSLESYLNCGYLTCLNNGIIISKKHNHVLLKLIDTIVESPLCFSNNKIECIQQITGPQKFTNIIYQNMNSKIKILPNEYLEPCLLDKCHITENTYAIHKHNLTWVPDNLKKIAILYLDYKYTFYCLIAVIAIIIISQLNRMV